MSSRVMHELERLIAKAECDREVLAVILFGSSLHQEERFRSDVDVCLVLDPHVDRTEHVALSRKRLEYMEDNSLDVRIFKQLPLYIRRRVLREGKVLFVRDEEVLYRVALQTARSFERFKHIYYTYLREVEDAGSRACAYED